MTLQTTDINLAQRIQELEDKTDTVIRRLETGNATTATSAGFVSVKNSTTATLTADSVFTGEGEDVSGYASVSVFYKSDVAAAASGLSIQFSQDNSNWDAQLVGDLGAKTFQVHRLVPAAKYFRVVYTNGTAAQSVFRLQCMFHTNATPVLITRAGQPQSTTDATPTRQTTEIDLDYARKHIPGGRAFFFFGFNDAVGTSWEDIHPNGGDINWQTAAQSIEIISTDAADNGTTPGLGVQSVEVHGLSATGEDQDEIILTNGTAAVAGTKTYIRINKLHSETCGTYGGSHEGDITCRVASAGATLSKMTGEEGTVNTAVVYGSGEAGNGYYSVPLGKVLYITRLEVIPNFGASNKTIDVALYEREDILDTTTPFAPRRVLWQETGVETRVEKEFKAHLKIKALTDIWFRAKGSATSKIEVYLDFYLLDEDASGA